ncbi:MAG: Crp/Fnr family transcriptional regulator [Burkholderiaceae bacterium]|nr:Crp/Fnr family transcriptional regulator [Burkholderiaceae bacterium]MCX8003887.1 Crp/Fnr family transcriptional regulator [Burkholderiaceae bacterium]
MSAPAHPLPDTLARICAVVPALQSLAPPLREELARQVHLVRLPAGATVFRENEGCSGFPIVLSGQVRVARTLENGREFQLYDVEPGESCVLSTGCLLGNSHYGAHGVCLSDVELALIPAALFERLIAEHLPFRHEVFHLFGERILRLLELVEAVGFQRLDRRLAAALLGKGARVRASHEQLAQALGVSRESVSRTLKQFEEHGWVKLGRGYVDLLSPRHLRELAQFGRAAAVTAVTERGDRRA